MHMTVATNILQVTTPCRDNYNSLTSAKLPPKNEDGQNEDGQLKIYLCGQKGRQNKHTN